MVWFASGKTFYGNRFADTDPHRATDFVKVAEGFGVKALRINTNDDIDSVLKEAFEYQGPVLVDCRISPDSNVLPMIPPGGAHTDIIENLIKEATYNERKLVLSVLVDNESGVLQRVASLFQEEVIIFHLLQLVKPKMKSFPV